MATEAEGITYPCPACGAVLFGWAAAQDPLDRSNKVIVDRCESCGLGVTRGSGPPDVAREIDEMLGPVAGGTELEAANLRSLQGSLGAAQWAGLEPERRRMHVTPESVRLLLSGRGIEPGEIRTPFTSGGHRAMRQTMLNAFTLRTNFLRDAREGQLPPAKSGTERWARRLDWFVSVVVWVPCAIFAYPLELLGARLGRGGVLEVDVRRAGESRD